MIHVYFHRDFDGICSAAIFSSYMKAVDSTDTPFEFVGVDYDLRNTWSSQELARPSAIVDFLYHPAADWWFDHHATTFVCKEWALAYRPDRNHVWNTAYKSCPRLIVDGISNPTIRGELCRRFSEYLDWCDLIDSAAYESPQQAIDCAEPALRINATLSQHTTSEYLSFLINCIRQLPLSTVADLDEVRERYAKAKLWQDKAISYIAKMATVSKGVAFVDLARRSELFHRYAAYYLWPDVAFQVALYKRGGWQKLTVGTNPWRKPAGPDLSAVCERYGGGGHPSVGGVVVKSRTQALRIGNEICRILRNESPFHQQLSLRHAISEPTATPHSQQHCGPD